jgi:hypothetical protein
MRLRIRLFGLPCTFCAQPVLCVDVYEIGVRTIHQRGCSPGVRQPPRAPDTRGRSAALGSPTLLTATVRLTVSPPDTTSERG